MTATRLHNATPVAVADIASISPHHFRGAVSSAVAAGARIAALFGQPCADRIRLVAILADGAEGTLSACMTEISGDTYPALTPDCPAAHWFEREIAEQWGVRPEGHPWLKPVRFHRGYRSDHDAWGRTACQPIAPGVTEFFGVEGAEVHEVAVGPVHAGVIEPGHFRFQCHGEQVLHLEISLGYQHRGIERAVIGGPTPRTIHYMETLAGDTSIGHATAYCEAIEALSGAAVPARAQVLRGIALELERLANHSGDLGALAGDVGYLPTASFCGRIRGDFLNLTAMICGSRFGRGLLRPGGVAFDLDDSRCAQMGELLEAARRDVTSAVELLWSSPSVQARFDNTGRVTRATGEAVGLVGPAARACGIERDVRHEFPSGVFRFVQIPVSTWTSGDVFARAYVRWLEIQRSLAFVSEQLAALPRGQTRAPGGDLPPDHLVATLIEGWRGEICHVAITGSDRRLRHYKIVDPSFHNWFGLAMALRDQQISDFPLCNKSFNLSYCGHDL